MKTTYTLQDLFTEGVVAVEFIKGQDSVADLNRLLKAEFEGVNRYYAVDKFGHFSGSDDTELPTVSLASFLVLLDAQEAKKNITLADFYAEKAAVEFIEGTDSVADLQRLLKYPTRGIHKFYWFDKKTYSKYNCGDKNDWNLPSAPLAFFIDLLNKHEAEKVTEYIYEPFNAEAAKNGAVVVLTSDNKDVVSFIHCHRNMVCAILDNGMVAWDESNFMMRFAVETKSIDCYVYEDGFVCSVREKEDHGEVVEKFVHQFKKIQR